MNESPKAPETFMEAVRFFADPDACEIYVEAMRWPDGVACPACQSKRIGRIETRRMYRCKDCRKQFSVKKGTVFEDSAIPLEKWLIGIWAVINTKNGASSYRLMRDLGLSQKSCWFMLQRIRFALQVGSFDTQLSGTVEVDETLVGGKAKFMHAKRREKFGKEATGKKTGSFAKVVVMGLLERDETGGTEVRTEVIQNIRRKNLDPRVRQNVEKGSTIHTDALPSYESLRDEYIHKTVDHSIAYVRDNVHTNGLENFWSLVKRMLKGTYISVEPWHLHRYMVEQTYRYNTRKWTDRQRFEGVLRMVAGKRLDYVTLVSASPV